MVKHLAEPVLVMVGVGPWRWAPPMGVAGPAGGPAHGAAGRLRRCGEPPVTVVSEVDTSTGDDAVMPPGGRSGPDCCSGPCGPRPSQVIGMLPPALRVASEAGKDPRGDDVGDPVGSWGMLIVGWVRFRADIHESIATRHRRWRRVTATGGGAE